MLTFEEVRQLLIDDVAAGIRRVDIDSLRRCRASRGTMILTHDTRYMPSMGYGRWYFGGWVMQSPNPFRDGIE